MVLIVFLLAYVLCGLAVTWIVWLIDGGASKPDTYRVIFIGWPIAVTVLILDRVMLIVQKVLPR